MTSGLDDVDGGKARVVLAGTVFGTVLLNTVMYMNGILHAELVTQFQAEDSLAAAVGGVNLGLLNFLGPLAGFLVTRWSCRTCAALGFVFLTAGLVSSYFVRSLPLLIFTYGCVAGTGQALLLNPTVTVVGHYFDKFRPIAAGISASGGSLAMLVGGPLIQFLLDNYGLHDMFLIVGAICLNWIPIIMLFGRTPVERLVQQKRQNLQLTVTDTSDIKVSHQRSWKRTADLGFVRRYLKNKAYLCYFLSDFFWSFGEVNLVIYLKSFVMARGTSAVDAANLFLAAGVSGAVSKVLVGFAANDNLIGPWMLHFSMLGIMGVLSLTFPLFAGSYEAQVAYAMCYGLFIHSLNALMTPINTLLVGVSHLGPAYGIECMGAGVAYFIGPPLAGLTTRFDSGYETTLYISGSLYLVSSLWGALAYIAVPKTPTTDEEGALHATECDADPASEKMLRTFQETDSVQLSSGDAATEDVQVSCHKAVKNVKDSNPIPAN